MPRKPRVHGSDTLYHVTVVAAGGAPMFVTVDDRSRLYRVLDYTLTKHDWEIRAFVLLTTHLHLLVWTADDDLSRGMQLATGIYCQSFNRVHDRRGHLVTGRFWSKVVDRPGQALETVRYIAMNPVRAGLVRRPEDWRWGSYHATLGLAPAPNFLNVSWVLELFDGDPSTAAEMLNAFVDAAVAAEVERSGVRPLQTA